MFRGVSDHTIDTKGRIVIPARFKEHIRSGEGGGVMVTRLDGCLVAYPYEEWGKIEERILKLPRRDESLRRFRRFFVGSAFDCNCDKQDRILIPPYHRDYAKLQKEIVLVGVLDHFEIWSKESYDFEESALQEDLKKDALRAEIENLGL